MCGFGGIFCNATVKVLDQRSCSDHTDKMRSNSNGLLRSQTTNQITNSLVKNDLKEKSAHFLQCTLIYIHGF